MKRGRMYTLEKKHIVIENKQHDNFQMEHIKIPSAGEVREFRHDFQHVIMEGMYPSIDKINTLSVEVNRSIQLFMIGVTYSLGFNIDLCDIEYEPTDKISSKELKDEIQKLIDDIFSFFTNRAEECCAYFNSNRTDLKRWLEFYVNFTTVAARIVRLTSSLLVNKQLNFSLNKVSKNKKLTDIWDNIVLTKTPRERIIEMIHSYIFTDPPLKDLSPDTGLSLILSTSNIFLGISEKNNPDYIISHCILFFKKEARQAKKIVEGPEITETYCLLKFHCLLPSELIRIIISYILIAYSYM